MAISLGILTQHFQVQSHVLSMVRSAHLSAQPWRIFRHVPDTSKITSSISRCPVFWAKPAGVFPGRAAWAVSFVFAKKYEWCIAQIWCVYNLWVLWGWTAQKNVFVCFYNRNSVWKSGSILMCLINIEINSILGNFMFRQTRILKLYSNNYDMVMVWYQ